MKHVFRFFCLVDGTMCLLFRDLEVGEEASPKSSPEGKDLALKTNKMPE